MKNKYIPSQFGITRVYRPATTDLPGLYYFGFDVNIFVHKNRKFMYVSVPNRKHLLRIKLIEQEITACNQLSQYNYEYILPIIFRAVVDRLIPNYKAYKPVLQSLTTLTQKFLTLEEALTNACKAFNQLGAKS